MARIRFAALVALTGVLPFTLLAFTLPAPRAPGRPLIPDGIYDGIATAQTLAYWRSKLALDVDEALMRHTVYFDPYLGSDIGDGSRLAPFRSFAKAKQECRTYTRCVLEARRYFSDATFRLSEPTGHFQRGELLTSGGEPRVLVVDYHPASRTLVVEDVVRPLHTGDSIEGSLSGATADVAVQVSTLSPNWSTYTLVDVTGAFEVDEVVSHGAGGAAVVVGYDPASATIELVDVQGELRESTTIVGSRSGATAVTDRDVSSARRPGGGIRLDAEPEHAGRIVTLYTSNATRPEDYPVVHCNGKDLPGGSVFSSHPTTTAGRLGVERIASDSCAADFVTQSLAGETIAFNTRCRRRVNMPGDQNNNCYTSHNTGAIAFVNAEAESITYTANGSPIAPTGTAGVFGANFTCVADVSVGAEGNACFSGTGGDVTLIEGSLRCRGTVRSCHGIAIVKNTPGEMRVRLARISILHGRHPNSIGITQTLIAPGSVHLFGRRLAISGYRGINAGRVLGGATSVIDVQGSILDGIGQYVLVSTTPDRHALTLRGVYDDDDPGGAWRIGGVTYETLAEARAAAPPGWKIFDVDSPESGGPSVDGDQFGGRDDLSCADPTRECWQAWRRAYVVELPETLRGDRWPVELTGGKQVDAFLLGGATAGYGAR